MIAPIVGLIIGICLCACLAYIVIHPKKNQSFDRRSQRRRRADTRYIQSNGE
jgi:hypothetical protein